MHIPNALHACAKNAPDTPKIPAHPTCLIWKMLHSEKGLIWNIQMEYAVPMTHDEFGVLPILNHSVHVHIVAGSIF